MCPQGGAFSIAALKLAPLTSVRRLRRLAMILFSTALALLSAGAMVGVPALSDAFSLTFVLSTFVAVCAAESEPHSH